MTINETADGVDKKSSKSSKKRKNKNEVGEMSTCSSTSTVIETKFNSNTNGPKIVVTRAKKPHNQSSGKRIKVIYQKVFSSNSCSSNSGVSDDQNSVSSNTHSKEPPEISFIDTGKESKDVVNIVNSKPSFSSKKKLRSLDVREILPEEEGETDLVVNDDCTTLN